MVFYIVSDVHPSQSLGFSNVEEPFHFPIQPMSHLLQHDIGIGIFAGVLPHGSDAGKYLIHIGQVEVAA